MVAMMSRQMSCVRFLLQRKYLLGCLSISSPSSLLINNNNLGHHQQNNNNNESLNQYIEKPIINHNKIQTGSIIGEILI